MDDTPRDDALNRKRKGSLRKTVLLGVERLRTDRRSSLSTGSNSSSSNVIKRTSPTTKPQSSSTSSPLLLLADNKSRPNKAFAFELPNSSTESHSSDLRRASTTSESASATAEDDDETTHSVEANAQDMASPTSTNNSTVSEDDDVVGLPFSAGGHVVAPAATAKSHPSLLHPPVTSLSPSPSPPSSESSGPASLSVPGAFGDLPRRRRSTLRPAAKTSPLTGTPTIATLPPIEEEWDYSDTEWWGWIILFVTWIVFVVGMGSCLGVWSWAWDVGETPYAPPELEDDPTLPIVGYYPALLVLTAVMSWVWVVVAWVGLKYFKHAKMGVVEDG